MPSDPLKISIKGSTQDHLPIEDIIDDIVLLKDGSCAALMKVSSVNFNLLSEPEQSALISAYGGILNSLNFPIQIVIQSTTKDVGSYLKRLAETEKSQVNPLLKERIRLYKKFIQEIVKKNAVLSKTFYVVVRFSTAELGLKKAATNNLFNFKKKTELPHPKDYLIEKAKANLEPKVDHLIRLFSRLGLEITELKNQELIELFYKIYNEEVNNNQKLQNLDFKKAVVTSK